MSKLCKDCFHREVCGRYIGNALGCNHFVTVISARHEEMIDDGRMRAMFKDGTIDPNYLNYLKILINRRLVNHYCKYLNQHRVINCNASRSSLFGNNIVIESELQVVIPNKITTIPDAVDEMLKDENIIP